MNESNKDCGLSVTAGVKGYWAKISGAGVWMLLIVFIFVASMAGLYIPYMEHRNREKEHAALTAVIAEQTTILLRAISAQTDAVAALRDAQNETTYVLTLSQKDRDALRLRQPESLRKRLVQ